MKYGDRITYIRNGQEHNALVVSDNNGSVSLVYLDPAMEQFANSGHNPVASASAVPEFKEGGMNGWVPADAQTRPLTFAEKKAGWTAKGIAADEAYKDSPIEPKVPETQIKHYDDGSSATAGADQAPLPDHSPEGAPEVKPE